MNLAKVMKSLMLFLLVLVLTGCFGGPTKIGSGVTSKDSYVKLIIDWDALDASTPPIGSASITPMALGEDVTLIGARVIAPEINALLAQSATRQSAETQGIITIPVPAVSDANLYAVAVNDSGDPVMFGVLTGITVVESTVLTITSNELSWTVPDAHFDGKVVWKTPTESFETSEDPAILASGELIAPDEIAGKGCGQTIECSADIYVNISDPFTSSPLHPMICAGGLRVTSPCFHEDVTDQNGDGWVQVLTNCPSNKHSACFVEPYVSGPMFSLSGRFYFGGPFGPFSIDWLP